MIFACTQFEGMVATTAMPERSAPENTDHDRGPRRWGIGLVFVVGCLWSLGGLFIRQIQLEMIGVGRAV